jgi:hypothetical protein
MKNFVVSEFLENRMPSAFQKEFESITKVENFMKEFKNGFYSTEYVKEPPYPYVWVILEEMTENGPIGTQSFRFYAK